MKGFSTFLIEEAKSEKESGQLKHITHAEDRPLLHGHAGFEHAFGALNQAHEHMKHGYKNSALTMKYDGSPSIVFGHHPKSGKFFVATKSAFNKKPKLNYTHTDIEKNKSHYEHLLSMHHHLTQAKNVLVKSLESHEGGLTHHIGSVKSKPEGFVVNHEHSGKTEPTKLVNRSEFAKANFLKNRG